MRSTPIRRFRAPKQVYIGAPPNYIPREKRLDQFRVQIQKLHVTLSLLARALLIGALVAACAGAAPAEQAKPAAPSKPGAAEKFDSARAWAHLERQVKFGPRPAGSPALADTRRYLIAELKALGLAVREQAFVGKTPSATCPW